MDLQIPERPLPKFARARRRAELIEAISNERQRSRHWLAPISAAAAVAVVGGAVALSSGLDGPKLNPGSPATERPAECTPLPAGAWVGARGVPRGLLPQTVRDLVRVLQSYTDVVGAHLDPQRRHLLSWPGGLQSHTQQLAQCQLDNTLYWSVPGENGLGLVRVNVSTSWEESQVRLAHQGWRSVSTDRPDVVEAFAVEYEGGFAVAATRTDGLAVAVDANRVDRDPRSRRYSDTGITGFGFAIDDLLDVVADLRFKLP